MTFFNFSVFRSVLPKVINFQNILLWYYYLPCLVYITTHYKKLGVIDNFNDTKRIVDTA